ncbi:hypothetical protein ACS0TY_005870 [Phlomoides rotata]
MEIKLGWQIFSEHGVLGAAGKEENGQLQEERRAGKSGYKRQLNEERGELQSSGKKLSPMQQGRGEHKTFILQVRGNIWDLGKNIELVGYIYGAS